MSETTVFTVLAVAGLRVWPSADKELDPASEYALVPEITLDPDIGPTEIGVYGP
jgi:hypothetical protein